MQDLLTVIEEQESLIPGIERLRGYVADIEAASADKPDHVLELCSALIECTSKNILKNHAHADDPERIEREKLKNGVRKSLNKVRGLDPLVDDAIIAHLCSAVQDLGNLRNSRGEVVHGRIHPKLHTSSRRFQNLVTRFTEAIAIYLIEVTADCAQIVIDDEDDKIEFDQPDSEDFNNFLDDEVSDDHGLHYGQRPSYALYLLDYDLYVERLEEWQDSEEREEE